MCKRKALDVVKLPHRFFFVCKYCVLLSFSPILFVYFSSFKFLYVYIFLNRSVSYSISFIVYSTLSFHRFSLREMVRGVAFWMLLVNSKKSLWSIFLIICDCFIRIVNIITVRWMLTHALCIYTPLCTYSPNIPQEWTSDLQVIHCSLITIFLRSTHRYKRME